MFLIKYTDSKIIKVRSVQAASVYRVAHGYKFLVKDKNSISEKYVDSYVDYKSAVINRSMFSAYLLKHGVTLSKKGNSLDLILMKFEYGVDEDNSTGDGSRPSVSANELRKYFYENNATITWVTFDKNKKEVPELSKTITYKMLCRNPGKAKKGECFFIREELYTNVIRYITMGLIDKIPDGKGAKIVELSAYAPLITATAIDFIHIPLDNILVLKDEKASCRKQACIVGVEEQKKQVRDFKEFEKIINPMGYTTYKTVLEDHPEYRLIGRTKKELLEHDIDIYDCPVQEINYSDGRIHNKCVVKRDEREISNILWDGMGLIDSSIFSSDMNGFIYCRSHFFKSCLFKGNIQQYFQDYYKDDYENAYIASGVDMFGRKMKVSNIKVIVTDNSLKWLKFTDYMSESGTKEAAFRAYKKIMKNDGYTFQIVKTAHSSKYGDLQRTSFQMNNTLLTTDENILEKIASTSIDFCNNLKLNDGAFIDYLQATSTEKYSINKVMVALYNWNKDIINTEYFKKKRREMISSLKRERLLLGKLFQNGDNLTICGNPIAMLMKVTGQDFLHEGCFCTHDDRIECYTKRFAEGERLAGFRNPHNSPNNIVCLENVYPEELIKYFPDLGKEIIVINGIGTDVQDRLNSQDLDSDTIYTTNQPEMAELAHKAYIEYPTIVNDIPKSTNSDYDKSMMSFANMDNKIANAQSDTGVSSNIAQLALSYWYDGGCESTELEDIFIICSVLAQCSIDSAKRNFDIAVGKELSRIQKMECMNPLKKYPMFYADVQELKDRKKKRKKKEIDTTEVKFFNCPMDILYQTIDKGIIDLRENKYRSFRSKGTSLRSFLIPLNKEDRNKANRKQQNSIIEIVEIYDKEVRGLEKCSEHYSSDKQDAYDECMKKLSGRKINENTMRALIGKALDNPKIMDSLFVTLYDSDSESFLKMFKKEQKCHTETGKTPRKIG